MRVQNVGATNYRKQQNFTSVQLSVGDKFLNVSLPGVRSLLKEIGSRQKPKKVFNALKHLAAIDRACNQGRARKFKVGVCGDGRRGIKLIGGLGKFDWNCPKFVVDLSPNNNLGRKLADAYCTMIAKYAKIEKDGVNIIL